MFNPDPNKNLWSYVKCKKYNQVTIPPLDVNGLLAVSDSQEQANAINSQFLFVYTQEDISTLPYLETFPYYSVITEELNVEGVAKLLTDLQSHKAHGPRNKIPAHF